jgi:hypothetical protein
MLKIVEAMRASIDSLKLENRNLRSEVASLRNILYTVTSDNRNLRSEVAPLRNILYTVTGDVHVPIMFNIANVSLYKYAVLPRVTGYTISRCLPNETKAEKRQGKYAENIRVFGNAESIGFSEEELNMWASRV